MEKEKYQYWLTSISGIGRRKIEKLLEICVGAEEIYHLPEKQIKMIYGIEEKDSDRIIQSKDRWDLEEEWEKLEQEKIHFISLENHKYPQKLRQITDRPYGIFWKGKLPDDNRKTAALVGARRCSEYGRAAALKLGESLAAYGVQVISGMAVGIDSFGHWGAIRGKGDTYAVFGCGPDVCYPKGAGELYDRIQKEGGIITEYCPKTQPKPGLFPQRNRIISAFADAVILVEAKERSGSLITADFALEQGKDIYAVPGRMDDVLSMGCNALIAQGAGIILSPEKLLLDLGMKADEIPAFNGKSKIALEKEELMVYSCFDLHAKKIEQLYQATGIEISGLADVLVRLKQKGLIEELFKNEYRKK